MRTPAIPLPKKQPFQLPMTTFSLTEIEPGRAVAHSLDFDLVAVAPTIEEAMARLRIAVKVYIEFGLSNGCAEDIHFAAPQEYWDRLTPQTPVSLGDPIVIDDTRKVMVLEANLIGDRTRAASVEA